MRLCMETATGDVYAKIYIRQWFIQHREWNGRIPSSSSTTDACAIISINFVCVCKCAIRLRSPPKASTRHDLLKSHYVHAMNLVHGRGRKTAEETLTEIASRVREESGRNHLFYCFPSSARANQTPSAKMSMRKQCPRRDCSRKSSSPHRRYILSR